MAGWLIDAGANVNAANDLGVTPLLVASTNASAPMVDRLLAAGANPNAVSVGGESPLLVASRAGNAAAVKALLAKGAQVNAKEPVRGQTALMWAVANRRDEVTRVLIAAGADIHARSVVTPREYQTGSRYVAYDDVRFVVKVEEGGFTPLLFAARSGDVASADTADRGRREGRRSGADRRDPADRRDTQRQRATSLDSSWSAAPIRTPPAPDTRRCTPRCCGATSGWSKRWSRAAPRSTRRSNAARRSDATARTSRSARISSARRRSGWLPATVTCRSCARSPRPAPIRASSCRMARMG